jgi:DNA replication protein DnaC
MLIQHTLTTLKGLRLFGMAHAFEEQLAQSAFGALSFEERIGLLVDREIADRDNRRLTRLLKKAKLKDSRACLEDLDYRASRGLDRAQIASLATMHWVRSGQSLLITGATGCGKTWLAAKLHASDHSIASDLSTLLHSI